MNFELPTSNFHAPEQFNVALSQDLAELGIPVSPSQLDAMARHYAAMVEANREFNLTRITDPTEAAVKHYADSLAMLRLVEERGWQVASVLDIGTGAGFPAIPLAIMRPEWRITALDGTKKKIDFLSSIAKELNLSNLCPIHAHSDHWKCGTAFDIVTGRAVSKLDEFIPSAVRLVSPSGHIVAYKTDPLPEAEQSATSTLPEKLSVELPFRYELSIGQERLRRALHVFTTC